MSMRHCSSCGRPVKGHQGQCGEKCELDIVSNISEIREAETEQASGTEPLETSSKSLVMTEVSHALLAISTSMQGLVEQNKQILALLSHQHGQRQGAAVNPHDGPLPSSSLHNVASLQASGDNVASTLHYLEGGTRITDATHKKAISGEFVNLTDFLPCIEHVDDFEAQLIDGELQYKPKRLKKSIDNFATWLQGWNEFESLIVGKYPAVYSKLSAYRKFIQAMDRKYNWHAVYCYDLRFRTELARTLSFNYDHQNVDLVVSILDATAVKSNLNRCYRCKSVDHNVQICPFPASNKVETNQKDTQVKTVKPIYKWFHQGIEGCNNFNQGKCNYPNCSRAHVCKGCRSAIPYVNCSRCNKS